jgi:very-short-patch-repair endonuclease
VGQALIIRDLLIPGDASTAWAVHLHAGPRSIVSGPIAARLQDWQMAGADHIVLTPHPVRTPDHWGVTVVRRANPEALHLRGLPPLAPRLDALTDTLLSRSERTARDLLDHALQQRWISADDLASHIDARSGRGRKGLSRLRRLHARAATGSRSEAEQRMGRLLASVGGKWVANHRVSDRHGRIIAELDFANPELMIAIEVDGRAFHSDRHSFERDRERQNMLVVRGWIVLRFTWERLLHDPEGVIAEVLAAMDSRTGLGKLRAESAAK